MSKRMQQTKTIIVPTESYVNWGGGIDCLKGYLTLLAKLSDDNPSVNILLLMPVLSITGRIIRIVKNIIKYIIHRPIEKIFRNYSLFDEYLESNDRLKIEKYYYNKKNGTGSIQQITKRQECPIVFPTMKLLPNLKCKQIGYIYDLQHISFPQFFAEKTRKQRDEIFKSQLLKCDGIIVHSKDVKRQLLETYPAQYKEEKIFSLPFLPVADIENLYNNQDVSQYELPEMYFIISNQLWLHKDHKTAFKALQLIHKQGYNFTNIICTGNTYDYRQPTYYQEIQNFIAELDLSKYIHFLGFIPKRDQITILKKSIGVIQPTLFEGGPGGGSTYEAVAYGVPAIISGIGINREIEHPLVSFFQVQNPDDLANKMMQLLEKPLPRPSVKDLEKQRNKNITCTTRFLQEMFNSI
jgi:glycosyltransferase involved in cell wall biosynthesis